MKIFLLPGYAYDCRIFDHLDFKDYQVERLAWIEPKSKENFTEYSMRLFSPYIGIEEPIILIGHSMGGMIAQEIATRKKIDKIILLSSIQSRKELPFFFKIVSPLKVYRFIFKTITLRSIKYWGKGHGFETKAAQALFKSMVGKHSTHYLRWALKALSEWQTPAVPSETSIFQIHGIKDKTFSFKQINNPDLVIEGGGHMMLYKKATEINDAILEELEHIETQSNV